MKNNIIKLLLSRSLFVKLMCGFITVLLIASSFNIVAYKFYVHSMEKEIINNTNERLDKIFDNLEQYLETLEKTIIRLSLEEDFKNVINKPHITDYDINILYRCLGLYKNDLMHVHMFYLLIPQIDFVITPYATYNKDRFFNVFYSNPVYNEAYWFKEMNENFHVKIYPAADFTDYTLDLTDYNDKKEATVKNLMPMAFKKLNNARFILIALIDMDSLMAEIDKSFMNNFYIAGGEELFYDSLTDADALDLSFGKDDTFKMVNRGYLFCRESKRYSIKYYKFFPDDEIMSQLKKTSFLFLLFIVISLMFSFGLSVYIVKRFNNPVKQIAEIIERSEKGDVQVGSLDFQNIRNYVQRLVSNNVYYQEQINLKDAMLKKLSYQFKIKKIYTYINQLVEEVTIENDYALIYFKVFYRDRYFYEISKDDSMGTYYLKELIELYMYSYFPNSITFNMEDNQIISIVNIGKENRNIKAFVEEIVDKLEEENDYIFFTIVIGRIYEDISKLSYAYDKIVEIAQYRQLNQETQILDEESIENKNNVFYFSLEQAEQFANLLLNGQGEECIYLVNSIMEYNHKKGVNQFCINLLVGELINHAIKVLMELYYSVPDKIDIHSIYSKINECSSIDEYIILLEGFITTVTEYINSNDREKDYIIDYVKKYIEEHYMEDIYLELLAENLNITKAYLSSYFKKKTGVNFSDYLNNFRVQKAIKYLEDCDMKIKDISAKVGIQNVNTFTRIFKKHTGYTPSEYKNRKYKTVASVEG